MVTTRWRPKISWWTTLAVFLQTRLLSTFCYPNTEFSSLLYLFKKTWMQHFWQALKGGISRGECVCEMLASLTQASLVSDIFGLSWRRKPWSQESTCAPCSNSGFPQTDLTEKREKYFAKMATKRIGVKQTDERTDCVLYQKSKWSILLLSCLYLSVRIN